MFVNSKTNGLWTVEFISTFNRAGQGVLVMNGGRLLGGDAGYYYSGTYKVRGTRIEGNVNIIRYDPTHFSVFGDIDHFTLSFTGDIDDYHFTAAATIPTKPEFQIKFTGNKKEDI
jgi:hypothetical protein